MKIKTRYNIRLLLISLILIFSVVNASLRLTENGMSSIFRIISPVFILILLISNIHRYKNSIIFMLVFYVYSLIVSIYIYNYIAFEYYIFFAYIYIVFILIKTYKIYALDFKREFFRFLDVITTISVILCIVQFFVRIPYPHVSLPAERGMNIFMGNENEMGEPLGCMLILYTYKYIFENDKSHIVLMILICGILFCNDAKLTIIGCAIGIAGLLLLKERKNTGSRLIKTRRYFSARVYVINIFIVIAISIALLYFINPILVFRDYPISVRELIFKPIGNIIKLQKVPGSGGSMIDRTNAIIYGMNELVHSHFAGIGLGNSVTMLAKPEYHLLTAKSMHNLFFQIICEAGILGIGLYVYFFIWGIKNTKYIDIENNIILKIIFMVAFIFISSQSSIGIMSNYYTWMIVFYVILIPTSHKKAISF